MNIAAFFDLDGTLLPPPSLERRFLRWVLWRGGLGSANLARWLARFFLRAPVGLLAATDGNKAHLAGVPADSVTAWAAWLDRYPVHIFPGALERLAWHHLQGHQIFVLSGTLEPLARVVLARNLPFPVVLCATRLDSCDGIWTGRILGDAICGPAKARALRALALSHGLDLARSFAYGDRFADRWMLDAVGHPAAVNPSMSLRCLARLRHWLVHDWCRGGFMPPASYFDVRATKRADT